MPTNTDDRVQIKFYVPRPWRDKFVAQIPNNERGDYIRQAIEEKFQRDFEKSLPSMRPQGQREFNLVAMWTPQGFRIMDTDHAGDYEEHRQYGIRKFEQPTPATIAVIDVPAAYDGKPITREDVAQQLQLDYLEWLE